MVWLRWLPLQVLVVAAIDTLLARLDHPHRPVDADLYLQACALWAVFAAIVLLPAWLSHRLLLGRRARASGRPPAIAPSLWLLAWLVLPVVGHQILDAHTSIGADVSGLVALAPWLQVAGAIGLTLVASYGVTRLARSMRPRTLAAAAAVLLVAAAVTGFGLPPRAVDAAPHERAAAAERPNLLLLVWDTTRADHTQPYGYDRETSPRLAEFAEDALVFEDARSVSCFTFTSHLSMLTGVYPSEHGARLVDTVYRSTRAQHVAALLRTAGYRTGAFVGTNVLAGNTGIRFGFEVYDDRVDPPVCDTRAWQLVHDAQSVLASLSDAFANDGQPHWFQDFQRPAPGVLDAAAEWIARDDPRPWFCFVNLYDVHWPYLPDAEASARLVRPYDGPMDGHSFRSDDFPDGYEPGPVDGRHVADLYDAEMWRLDRRVHAFLEELDLDTTAVIVTSDHGEAFGEAGAWEHDDIYEPQVQVPFVLRLPGAEPRSGVVATPSAGVDVAPTLLGVAGLEIPEQMKGLDLSRLDLPSERAILVEDRDHVELSDIRLALYDGTWKLVQHGLGEDRSLLLHDLATDPVGEVDVGDAYPQIRDRLAAELTELRARWGGDAADLAVPAAGPSNRDALDALGYMGDGGAGTPQRPEREKDAQ